MATWNAAYEANPQNFKNPGEGAFHLRDTKSAVRERESIEHVWGDDEATIGVGSGGLHKEGSARVLVSDDASALRPSEERFTSTIKVGRVQVDSELLSTLRTQDGTDLQDVAGYSYKDQRAKKIKVAIPTVDGDTGLYVDGTDSEETELAIIFDWDQLVDLIQDQVIKGIKEFVTSPQVPNIAVGGETVREAWENLIDTGTAKEKLAAVNVSEVYDRTEDSRYHNIFDSTDTDNTTIADANSPTGFVVDANIEASSIYGTIVRGAVWSA